MTGFVFRLKYQTRDQYGIELAHDNLKVKIQPSPFRIDMFVDGEPVISFNARGLLKIEAAREKPG